MRSGLSDDQAVSGSSDNLLGDNLNLIDLEDSLDLGQEAGHQPEVSPTPSDQRGDHVGGQNRREVSRQTATNAP